MNMQTLKKSTVCVIILTHITAFSLPAAQAAPGTLASAPLYLGTAVEPNIMFLLDDSGSMDWEFMIQGAADGLFYIGSTDYEYILPGGTCGSSGCDIVPTVGQNAGSWRARNSTYNGLYYNPAITYEPWDGVNASGAPLYTNASLTAARGNPNTATPTLNLTANVTVGSGGGSTFYPAHYYTWSDTNATAALSGNGIVDATDNKTLVEIKSANAPFTKASTRTDCVGATCTYAEEIQNFANWYTYYRKRMYVAKKAIGTLVDKASGTRMGLDLYNNTLLNGAKSMNTAADKLALLQSLYGVTAGNGTPARTALQSLGNLFEGSTTSSPILSAALGGTCQQNFAVVMTDGYWNGSAPSGIGNTDIDGAGSFDGAPYADTYSNTLADVAMHYYERDLKTSLADKVPTTPGVDDAKHQHLVTYTLAFGVTGTLNPATANPKAVGFLWPNPVANDFTTIDDTWHAAYNGRGLFLSARDPATLSASLGAALTNIEERSSSAAAVAFNSTSLSANSVIYQAQFNTAKWSGELSAFALDPVTGAISSTPLWNAATQVNLQSPASRVMLTYNPTTNTGIPFTWDTTKLSVTQQNDLNMGVSAADTRGADRVAYLRGDRTHEGSGTTDFRKRSSNTVLGDIAHSNPVYVGAPNLPYPDTAPFPTGSNAYSTFKTSQASRPGVVYVGANDGFLHGFDANTGNEVMAYAPHNLFSAAAGAGLHYLTEKTYVHRYYVDAGAAVADAFVATVPGGTAAWKTVLVGSERGVGRGVFALDVTNPVFSQSGSAPNDVVMWEFTHADLGYTYSKPSIALMNNGRWAAIFGNGYEDIGSGEAKLFILYLDGGLDGVWTAGTDYMTIATGVGTPAARNGLASPTLVDTDDDKMVDRIYAGDLLGNMWVFNVSSTSSGSWGMAHNTAGVPRPLFTAKSAAGAAQPITSKPSVGKHASMPNTGTNLPNLMVYVGTGQYIVSGDTSSTATQTFYGVWDNGAQERLRAHLVPQTITTTGAKRTLSNTAVDYATKFGWYIDLDSSAASTGERVAVDSLIRDNEIYFNTMIPLTAPCSFGGSGWAMRVNRDNGGLPNAPVFDTDGNGVVNNSDSKTGGELVTDGIMTESKILGDVVYTSTSDGKITPSKARPPKPTPLGRQSWIELIQ